jgi:predicted dehydrogenase
MTLRWGILGPGGIAKSQTRDLLANGFTVTAVGSRTLATAEAFAAEFGIATAHGSYEALVADPEVDAIYVATPHPFHVTSARLALEAGKHVLLEKPFTVNAADARSIVDLARERGLVVLEAMWTRFLPHMVRIRESVAAGELGEVTTVIADHTQRLPSDPSHRLQDPALAGGALLDLGIYPVSLAHDVLGTPTAVLASATFTPTGVDRQTSVILEFAGDRRAVLHTALDTSGPNTAAIIGTHGRIEIDSVWYNSTSFTRYDEAGTVVERFEAGTGDSSAAGSRGMQWQAWEVERLVDEGRISSDIMPPEETVAIMETLDTIRERIGLVYPGESAG